MSDRQADLHKVVDESQWDEHDPKERGLDQDDHQRGQHQPGRGHEVTEQQR